MGDLLRRPRYSTLAPFHGWRIGRSDVDDVLQKSGGAAYITGLS